MADGLEQYGYAQEPDYLDYLPTKFERAGTPTGLQQFGDESGAGAVRTPMSFGSFHPVDKIPNIERLKSVNPELIKAEKELYVTTAAKVYRQKVENLNSLAVQAAKMGFDITRPNPLNKKEFELYQTYNNFLADAKNTAADLQDTKKTYDLFEKEVADNKGRFTQGFYDKGFAPQGTVMPTPQDIKNNFIYNADDRRTTHYENKMPADASSLSTLPQEAETKRQELIAYFQSEAEKARANGDEGREQQMLGEIPKLHKVAVDNKESLDLQEKRKTTALAREKQYPVRINESEGVRNVTSSGGKTYQLGSGGLTVTASQNTTIPLTMTTLYNTNNGTLTHPKDQVYVQTAEVMPYLVYKNNGKGFRKVVENGVEKVIPTKIVGGQTILPFKNHAEMQDFIQNASPEELNKYQIKTFLEGTALDPTNVSQTFDQTTGGWIYGAKDPSKGTNITFLSPLNDKLKADPSIIRLNNMSGGEMYKALDNPNGKINQLKSLFEEKVNQKTSTKPIETKQTKTNSMVTLPKDQTEANKIFATLKSGEKFIAPDGTTRIKP